MLKLKHWISMIDNYWVSWGSLPWVKVKDWGGGWCGRNGNYTRDAKLHGWLGEE